jgi:hypothetical protein
VKSSWFTVEGNIEPPIRSYEVAGLAENHNYRSDLVHSLEICIETIEKKNKIYIYIYRVRFSAVFCTSQCCVSEFIFFGFGSPNGVSHCFRMCSGTCTTEEKVFQQKNLSFFSLSSV